MSLTYDKFERVFDGAFPRFTKYSTLPPNSKLQLVVDHYKIRPQFKDPKRHPINLYFCHGTGMNKSIWKYYAKRLMSYSFNHPELSWQINNIIAIDSATHGESAILNNGKLGYEYDWRDGGRDLNKIANQLNFEGFNIGVGHSMGGFHTMFAASLSPALFRFMILIEPVSNIGERYMNKEIEIMWDNLMAVVDRALITEFPNESSFNDYFQNKGFFTKFNKEILHDLIESEKLIHSDGKVSTKTNKQLQMISYTSSKKVVPIGLDVVERIDIPLVHIQGDKSDWTIPAHAKIFRNHIKQLDPYNIPHGRHLVNGEHPEDILGIIIKSLNKYILNTDEVDFTDRPQLNHKEYTTLFNKGYNEHAKKNLVFRKKKRQQQQRVGEIKEVQVPSNHEQLKAPLAKL
ncbi:Abhydrolase domain-containing protein 11 [Wickerhamomyces ciferrii]|uniref:Abhydrolase domain-containing protein 11 n=1 Tax=Wickerhamomyces ciferrii (strain ATCC 14091 / BCRC 22168 / CBS 111 / JCM 3599 / NBRC 0793 / NRRL Y-1031 F-60-10) TaxID=1206466 RepID=K0KHW0_WICCF|nr:Abhydrolase domain-containing protein 11 [Wickerhamomyces ciferrii]CCH44770.1 Abhydrolase domain-containing protein 11 [Wickerhamomyces ciferrii]